MKSVTVLNRMLVSQEVPILSLVFVYGTLKKNEPNHHLLGHPDEAGLVRFKGEGITKQAYPLVIATKYNVPFLLDSPGLGKNVRGEIYEVNDVVLSQLDQLEEHPKFYHRRLEPVLLTGNSTEEVQCWIYFLPKFKQDLLKQPMLESYSNNSDPNLRYRERYLRDPEWNYKKEVMEK